MKKVFTATLALALIAGISTASFAQDVKKEAAKTEKATKKEAKKEETKAKKAEKKEVKKAEAPVKK